MKFLEISELDVLSNALSMSTPTLKVTTRIEAYSCKQVSKERKLFKTLESELIQDISHSTSVSPPEHHPGLLESAFGPLDKPQSRKTLWLLIGLLNVAFPDHDFSKVRPEEFSREESPRAVLASLSAAVDHLRSPTNQRSFSSFPGSSAFGIPSSPYSDPIALPGTTPTNDEAIPTNPFLRQVLDPIIDLAECEVFTYTPSTGGLLWSTFQFLYNRKAKRIVFINAWARTPVEARGRRRFLPSSTPTPRSTVGGLDHAAHLKRSASTSSVASIPLTKKKAKATA